MAGPARGWDWVACDSDGRRRAAVLAFAKKDAIECRQLQGVYKQDHPLSVKGRCDPPASGENGGIVVRAVVGNGRETGSGKLGVLELGRAQRDRNLPRAIGSQLAGWTTIRLWKMGLSRTRVKVR